MSTLTNTLNTPVEALERAYPLRVLRYRLRQGSGGVGLCNGGDGIARDLLMLEDVTVTLITERRVSRPWGLAGGGPGAVAENWLLPGGDEVRAERLSDKCAIRLRAGDVLRMLTPGGGPDPVDLTTGIRPPPMPRSRGKGRDGGSFRPRWRGLPSLGGMDIDGVSAIVTGGASGLGEATSRQLAGRGARVVVLDMADDKGEPLAKEVGGVFVHADVTNPDEVQAAVDAAVEMGPLRVLVNCAGIGWAQRTVDRSGAPHDLGVFEKVVAVNLIGTFNCIRLAASAMSATEPLEYGERGAVVNTASVAAFDGQIGQASYSASKGGVVGMTLPIARDLAAVGIRVNTIAPGLIDTPLLGLLPDPQKEALGQSVLFPKRLGTPADFASLATELVTNGYINGETIRLDGGIRMPPK